MILNYTSIEKEHEFRLRGNKEEPERVAFFTEKS